MYVLLYHPSELSTSIISHQSIFCSAWLHFSLKALVIFLVHPCYYLLAHLYSHHSLSGFKSYKHEGNKSQQAKSCSNPSYHHLKPISIFWKCKCHCFLSYPLAYSPHQKGGDASSLLHRVGMFNYLWYLKYFWLSSNRSYRSWDYNYCFPLHLPEGSNVFLWDHTKHYS